MRPLAAGALLLTMGCSLPPGEMPNEVGLAGSPRCRAESLGDLVGQPATQALGAEALRRSGSRVLRWIRPGDVVTMEYLQVRLNAHLDAQNRTQSFACG